MLKKIVILLISMVFMFGAFSGCYKAGKVTGEAVEEIEEGAEDFEEGYEDGKDKW